MIKTPVPSALSRYRIGPTTQWVLTLWLAAVAFAALFAYETYFPGNRVALAGLVVVAINGICFIPNPFAIFIGTGAGLSQVSRRTYQGHDIGGADAARRRREAADDDDERRRQWEEDDDDRRQKAWLQEQQEESDRMIQDAHEAATHDLFGDR